MDGVSVCVVCVCVCVVCGVCMCDCVGHSVCPQPHLLCSKVPGVYDYASFQEGQR